MSDTFVIAACDKQANRNSCGNCKTVKSSKDEAIELYETWRAGTRQKKKYMRDVEKLNSLEADREYICAERTWSNAAGVRVKTCSKVLKYVFVSAVTNYAFWRDKIAEN